MVPNHKLCRLQAACPEHRDGSLCPAPVPVHSLRPWHCTRTDAQTNKHIDVNAPEHYSVHTDARTHTHAPP